MRALIGLALAWAGMPAAARAQAAPCCTIAAETAVRIEIVAPVSSRSSRTGELFPIRLAEPILVDGRALVPAGVTGIGEVVHAARARGIDPGELILAARYLSFGGIQVPLHRLSFALSGTDGHIRTFYPMGAIVRHVYAGRDVAVPAGARLQAVVAGDVHVPMPAD